MKNKILKFPNKENTKMELHISIERYNTYRYKISSSVPCTNYSEYSQLVSSEGLFLKRRINKAVEEIKERYEAIKEYLIVEG